MDFTLGKRFKRKVSQNENKIYKSIDTDLIKWTLTFFAIDQFYPCLFINDLKYTPRDC